MTTLLGPSPRAWKAIRSQLLETKLSELALEIDGSPIEPAIERLYREIEAKGLAYFPPCYLTDGWGCPDRVPVIGIPFYLASPWLSRLEEEETGELEDERTIMKLLRHEAGHAFNYAYRLWEEPGWAETFGSFWKPYRDSFDPMPWSRRFVRHVESSQYGRSYAQKHPDEDFAETFAVWLTPRSAWRRRYRGWPALRKLQYVDEVMRRVRELRPLCEPLPLFRPVERLAIPLKEHYGGDGRSRAPGFGENGGRRGATGVRRKARGQGARRPKKRGRPHPIGT